MGDLDILIVAKGFKKLTKVRLIAQSGHTGSEVAKGQFLVAAAEGCSFV